MDTLFNIQALPSLRIILYLLVTGVLIFITFEAFRRYALPLIRYYRKNQRHLERWLPLIETIVWTVYIAGWAAVLIQPSPLVGLLFLVAAVGAVWFFFRDLIAGLVIRTWNYYRIGQKIRTESFGGVVTRLGRLVAEVETDRGEVLVIPYFRLSRMSVLRESPSALIKSHAIDIPISESVIGVNVDAIRRRIATFPWTIADREPVVELNEREEGHAQLRVVLYGIDQSHLVKMEKQLEAMLHKQETD